MNLLAHSCILCEIECENPLRHRSHILSRLRPNESTVETEKKKKIIFRPVCTFVIFGVFSSSLNQFLPFIIVVVQCRFPPNNNNVCTTRRKIALSLSLTTHSRRRVFKNERHKS
jgi:hypothetical protein